MYRHTHYLISCILHLYNLGGNDEAFFHFSLALLGITAGNWFYGRYVVLGGKIYPRNATVLVLPEAVPAQRLRRFQNLYWVDLRGRGLTVAEYEEISHVVGDARILWELDFQGTPIPSTAREIQIDHLSDEEVEALDYLPRLRLVRGKAARIIPSCSPCESAARTAR